MAMGDENLEERTEDPTPQRREEWRREGRVLQSREVVGSFLLLATTGALYMAAQWSLKGIWSVFESTLGDLPKLAEKEWTIATAMAVLSYSLKSLFFIGAPICGAAFVAAIVASVAQTGFVWTTKPLEIDLDKINPINGLSRIFSLDGSIEMAKAVLKFVVVGAVVYSFLYKRIKEAPMLWNAEAPGMIKYLGLQLTTALFSVGLSMFVLAAFDYAYQRFRFEQRIRMTKQEVREERKQHDGNPQIRARIRGLQRRMAQSRMMEAVKKADVVVTNPTHIAVALLYDRENMHAPKVIAKGADYMAEQIKKIAREAGIPCVENVPLARAMYKALKIGQFISKDLYNAVAEVLAYVYRLKGRTEL